MNAKHITHKNIFPAAAALVSGAALVKAFSISTANMFAFYFLLLLYPVFKKAAKTDKKAAVIPCIAGLLFTVAAFAAAKHTAVTDGRTNVLLLCLYALGFFMMFTAVSAVFAEGIKHFPALYNGIKKEPKAHKAEIFAFFGALITQNAFVAAIRVNDAKIYSPLFAILLYVFYLRAAKVKNKKIWGASLVCGVIFTVFSVFAALDIFMKANGFDTAALIMFAAGYLIFLTSACAVLYDKIKDTDKKEGYSPEKELKIFVVSMFVMLLAWLPYFLYLFPGDISIDSLSQIKQALGLEALSNHHPIAHTMIIRFFMNIGKHLFGGDLTKALALYTAFQAFCLAVSFAYLTATLYKAGASKIYIILTVIGYSFISYHAVFSATIWKDVWFGGIAAALTSLLYRVISQYRSSKQHISVFNGIMLFVFGAAMCLFRSNGLYAFALLTVCMSVYAVLRNHLTPVFICIAALAFSLFIKGPVYKANNITPPDTIEALSVPVQQISAVITYGGELTPKQAEMLENIADVSLVPREYLPSLADPIKELVRAKNNQRYILDHKGGFLKLWLDLGLKYPHIYLISYLNLTHGYWDPDIQDWIYWIYPIDLKAEGLAIDKASLLPEGLGNIAETLRNLYIYIPYLGLLWSIGAAVWILIFMTGAAIIKRPGEYILIYLPIIAVWLTIMIATPVYAEFRYLYSIFTTLPLLCMIPFSNDRS